MSDVPPSTATPGKAGPELMILEKWEAFAEWFLVHTARWPKSCRFTLTQRLENHALDVEEELVSARYSPKDRLERLAGINPRLELMRRLLGIARSTKIQPGRGFETSVRAIDEVGRMIWGWRDALKRRVGQPPVQEGRGPEGAPR